MSKPARHIAVTLRMDDKHEERSVRRLLKTLLRRYDLICVGLADATVATDEKPATDCASGPGIDAGVEKPPESRKRKNAQ